MIIAMVNAKGGVGKTTSTILLGCAIAARGKSVEVWDSDPQGSATEWALDAAENGEALPFPVSTVNKINLVRGEGHSDVVIIDTPPGNAGVIQAAIDRADVIIIPTIPSPLDMKRVWSTLDVAAQKPAAVLLTSVEPHTTLVDDFKTVFQDEDVFCFATEIPKRQAIRKVVGMSPQEFFGYDKLFTELMEVLA